MPRAARESIAKVIMGESVASWNAFCDTLSERELDFVHHAELRVIEEHNELAARGKELPPFWIIRVRGERIALYIDKGWMVPVLLDPLLQSLGVLMGMSVNEASSATLPVALDYDDWSGDE